MAKAKYEENFKKSLVALYRRGKTKHSICQEFTSLTPLLGNGLKSSTMRKILSRTRF